MWCKENSKEGSANGNGFLASTTAINMGVAKNRTSRGKQYGHRVLQRLRHFLHCKNKLLFCLPQCSSLITYQAACTWQFRKLWTQASTEWGLPQWSMWRFKTKVCCFTYSPFFLHEGVADAGPVPVHSLLQTPSQKPLSWTLLGWQPHRQTREQLYTDSCLSNIRTVHFHMSKSTGL